MFDRIFDEIAKTEDIERLNKIIEVIPQMESLTDVQRNQLTIYALTVKQSILRLELCTELNKTIDNLESLNSGYREMFAILSETYKSNQLV